MSNFNLSNVFAGIQSVVAQHSELADVIATYTANADPYVPQKRNTHDEMDNVEAIVTDRASLKELVEYVWGETLCSSVWGSNGFFFTMKDEKIVLCKGEGFKAANPIAFVVFILSTIGVYRQKAKGSISLPKNYLGEELNVSNVVSSSHLIKATFNEYIAKGMAPFNNISETFARLAGATSVTANFKPAKEWVEKISKSKIGSFLGETSRELGCDFNSVGHALVAYATAKANPNVSVITDGETFAKVQAFLTLESLPNLFHANFTDGLNFFNYFHTIGECALGFELFSAATKNITVEYGAEECKVWFEKQAYTLNKIGVYDDRGRRLNGLLIKSGPLSLVNGLGALLVSVVCHAGILGNAETKSVGELYRTLSEELQWDSEEESGGQDEGDRAFYNFYTTSEYSWNGALPIRFVAGKIALASEYKTLEGYSGTKSDLDEEAFNRFNLVRMHKGRMPFINGALVTFRLDLVESKYQHEVLEAILKLAGHDDIASGLRTLFPEYESYEESDLLRIAYDRVCLGLSTKLAKITKRVGLAYAKHAEAIGGEERAFRQFGQNDLFGYSTGHTVNVAFLERAIAAPGLAFWIGGDRPVIANRKSVSEVYDLYDMKAVAPDGEHLFGSLVEGYVLTHDLNKGQTASFEHVLQNIQGHDVKGIYLEQGHAVFRVPFVAGGKQQMEFICMPEAGLLRSIHWTTNNFGELVVKVTYCTLEQEFKWRNGIKCMVGELALGAETIYHNLNKNLPARIQAIIPGDGIKSKDVSWRDLDLMFQTIKGLDAGSKLVSLYNQVCGLEDSIGVNFSPVAAIFGLYDSLIKEFVSTYSQGIWLNYMTDESQYIALSHLYLNKVEAGKGWARVNLSSIDPVSGESFEDIFGKDALVISNGNECDPTVDVLVFYEQDGEYCWHQRTYGFVGTQETGCVRLNVKTEISTVAQAVGTTALMSSVARCVATGIAGVEGDKEGALALMADGMPMVYKYMALQSAAKRLPISNELGQQLTVIKMFEGGKFTHEFMTAISVVSPEIKEAATKGELSLEMLTAELSEVVFDMGGLIPYLWLPAISALDPIGSSKATLSGAVRALFQYIFMGTEPVKLSKSVVRISQLIKKMVESKSMKKKILQGRKSAQSKAVGIGGVPIDELWVLKTGKEYPNSIYRTLRKVFALQGVSDIDGQKVLLSRSPMPFPCVLRVRVIYANEWRSFAVTPHVAAMNPIAVYVTAGDFDG